MAQQRFPRVLHRNKVDRLNFPGRQPFTIRADESSGQHSPLCFHATISSMAALDTRSRDILMILLHAKFPIPVRQVAEQLEITPRMARSSLDVIEAWLGERGARLVRKPNFGVYIDAGPTARDNLIHDLSKQKEYLLYLSQVERINVLILMLLRAGEDPLPIDQIEPVLGISRPTLFKDLNKVEAWLHSYGLELVHKARAGLQIIGPESSWREAMTGFLLANFGVIPLLALCKDTGSKLDIQANSNLNLLNAMQIDVLQSLDLPFSYRKIKRLEQALQHKFTDISCASLVCHLALSIARTAENKVVSKPAGPTPDGEEASAVRLIASDMAARDRIFLGAAEVAFLTRQVLGAKIQYTITELTQLRRIQEDNTEIREIVDSIVQQASLYLHPSLKVDRQLIRALSYHIPVALNRMRYNLPIHNPLLKDVKAQYPHILHIASKSVGEFEKKIHQRVPEDEIAYIAMHLGAAMERLRPFLGLKRRVWIVCGEGSATAWLLVSRLQAEFTDVEVVEVTSALEIARESPSSRAGGCRLDHRTGQNSLIS